MSTRPTRKQPDKKKPAASTKPAAKKTTAAAPASANRVMRAAKNATKKSNKYRGVFIFLAILFVIIIIAGGCGYFLTGKTISYYYVDDSLFEEAGYEHDLLTEQKYRLFSSTQAPVIDDYFEDDNLQNWKLSWYADEDGKIPLEETSIGFGDLQKKQSVYGWLTEKNEETPGAPAYEGTYYNAVVWTVKGLNLKLREGFKATNYNFAGKGNGLVEADTPVGKDKVYGIYSGIEFDRDWKAGKNFEREHVWCNSLLGMDRVTSSGKNQASDLHNLRAIGGTKSDGINQARSNRYFVDCKDANCTLDKDDNDATHNGHTVGKDAFYPGDKHVGDVSRILMYMMFMYDGILTLPPSETALKEAVAYHPDYAYMPIANTDLLVTWHKQDPVDEFETHRNNVIYGYQGNRNPFIDKPDQLEPMLKLLTA